MAEQKDLKSHKRVCIGLLAHVDAGKTTLSEDILFHTGVIRKAGRVDHRDTFFDTDIRERKRGITIFSKEAHFEYSGIEFTLMDTPGHTDFSAEMERTLSVLDAAVLIISGPDGVQSHTRTLWRLIRRYDLPVFIFVNKMDMEGVDREEILSELRAGLSQGCIDFSDPELLSGEESLEELSLCDERLMDQYLSEGSISDWLITEAIKTRSIVPCIFGSALKDEGVDRLLSVMAEFAPLPEYDAAFSAIVYKITRDERGNRLTHMKVTGGSLSIKDDILLPLEAGAFAASSETKDTGCPYVTEKVERIRVCNGNRYIDVRSADAGMLIAAEGLKHSHAGMYIGRRQGRGKPVLVPLFEYSIVPPFDVDRKQFYLKLKDLEEEIPELLLSYVSQNDEIHIRLMGDVQNEILRDLIQERFGVPVEFTEGSIIYKETIASKTEGVGHFEPLRHYAEVHLLLEPGEPSSGIEALDLMGEGKGLSGNYRRLILSHILEKIHKGVLTGSELTDVRISLINGRSHDKHTEGGDFREATYRAVRQGLMYAENMLLEPYYEYRLELPSEYAGRAINDIQRMEGSFELNSLPDGGTELRGKAPVSMMRNYNSEVMSYTKGLGRLSLEFSGYGRCHDPEEVIRKLGYDPEADISEPVGSVFCSHGAGYYVNWDQVYDMMHLPLSANGSECKKDGLGLNALQDRLALAHDDETDPEEKMETEKMQSYDRRASFDYMGHGYESDRELMSIFRKTFGLTKSERYSDKADDEALLRSQPAAGWKRKGKKKNDSFEDDGAPEFVSIKDRKKSYLLVDGYNIIFAWDELRELSKLNLDSARILLMDILSNYQGYKGMNLILVFDAYKVKGGRRKIEKYHNIYVVYTEEAETADKYIERTVHDMDKKHDVTVATSDGLEQIIVFGEGAVRLSARDLYEEVMKASEDMREVFLKKRSRLENTVLKEQGREDLNDGRK